MKKLTALLAVAAIGGSALLNAQPAKPADANELKFTTVKANPITSVKNQASSGTCWCYSTISFLESEILKAGYKGDDLDLSEMFIVSHAYQDKADKFIRLDGHLNYEQGSDFGDVIETMRTYGIVPQEIMQGLNYGEKQNAHSELVAGLKGYVNAIKTKPNRNHLTTAWKKGLVGILDAYLGECPDEFSYGGKTYTPASYRDALGINLDDYVSLTSFTHHPFYTQFAIEVCDNWRWTQSYNLPIDEFMEVMYNAINTGYTIAWGSDVSESGFTRNGIATMKDTKAVEAAGSDQARWVGTTPEQKNAEMQKMRENAPEMTITQEMRQIAFDNKETTDDHGMHIFGLAKDQNGVNYFMVKNSWGTSSKYEGIWYASDSYVRYKTLNILVNKNAIPKDIRKKLNIK